MTDRSLVAKWGMDMHYSILGMRPHGVELFTVVMESIWKPGYLPTGLGKTGRR
jgi:hypothetical protein